MTSPVWINRGKSYWSLNIERVEHHYKAKYVGDFCLNLGNNGIWSETPFAIFFCEFPAKPEYTQYFAMNIRNGVYIRNGISATEGHWNGMVADDGEVIYSRYRHDFRESTDGSVIVDGGRDYFKVMGNINNPHVKLTIVRDQIVVNDTLILPYEDPRKIIK